jgi:hypothetical protein
LTPISGSSSIPGRSGGVDGDRAASIEEERGGVDTLAAEALAAWSRGVSFDVGRGAEATGSTFDAVRAAGRSGAAWTSDSVNF